MEGINDVTICTRIVYYYYKSLDGTVGWRFDIVTMLTTPAQLSDKFHFTAPHRSTGQSTATLTVHYWAAIICKLCVFYKARQLIYIIARLKLTWCGGDDVAMCCEAASLSLILWFCPSTLWQKNLFFQTMSGTLLYAGVGGFWHKCLALMRLTSSFVWWIMPKNYFTILMDPWVC